MTPFPSFRGARLGLANPETSRSYGDRFWIPDRALTRVSAMTVVGNAA